MTIENIKYKDVIEYLSKMPQDKETDAYAVAHIVRMLQTERMLPCEICKEKVEVFDDTMVYCTNSDCIREGVNVEINEWNSVQIDIAEKLNNLQWRKMDEGPNELEAT